MTKSELERRIEELERRIALLEARQTPTPAFGTPVWIAPKWDPRMGKWA